jgi:hypothetical protein
MSVENMLFSYCMKLAIERYILMCKVLLLQQTKIRLIFAEIILYFHFFLKCKFAEVDMCFQQQG